MAWVIGAVLGLAGAMAALILGAARGQSAATAAGQALVALAAGVFLGAAVIGPLALSLVRDAVREEKQEGPESGVAVEKSEERESAPEEAEGAP